MMVWLCSEWFVKEVHMGRVQAIADCPRVVCLCGSTRFYEMFQALNFAETLAGHIVLSIGCDTKSDEGLLLSQDDKGRLDELHLRKIDLADEVVVVNVGGYVGESTVREIVYAASSGKSIRWLVVPSFPARRCRGSFGEGMACQYGECGALATWWCDDGSGEFFFCERHVFFLGYPVEGES
jgi:hypothetical protein